MFCFDGDTAGRKAARRALENALPVMQDGRQVKFLFLPEGEDPDTLVRQIGADKFSHMIELAVPLEDFLFDAVSEGIDLQSMEGRARLSKLAAPLLNKLPKGVYRELMFDNLASRTGLSRDTLIELIKELPAAPTEHRDTSPPRQQPGRQPTKPAANSTPVPTAANNVFAPPADDHPPSWATEAASVEPPPVYDDLPETSPHSNHYGQPADHQGIPTSSRYLMPPKRKLIALLLSQPSLASVINNPEYWEQQTDPDLQLFAKLVKILQQRPHYKLHHLIGYWRAAHGEQETQYLADIAGIDLVQATRTMAQSHTPETPGYDLEGAFRDTLAHLNGHIEEAKSAKSLEKLKNADFTVLSTEDKQRLVAEALAGKRTTRD